MLMGHKTYQKTLWAAFFLLPSLAGLLIFMVIPMISSLALTFYEWDPLIPTRFHFLGLQNYIHLINDPDFWTALSHTLI